MAAAPSRALLISANVGTLFEEYQALAETWLSAIAKVSQKRSNLAHTPDPNAHMRPFGACQAIEAANPGFVALHMQELGGKAYQDGIANVDNFAQVLLEHLPPGMFDRSLAILDDSGQSPSFTPWTRKGFSITRWRLNEQPTAFINSHLFHDASNMTALKTSPSQYALCRQQALQYTVDAITQPDEDTFLFGDLNFRLALKDALPVLAQRLKCVEKKVDVADGGEKSVVLRDANGDDCLCVTAKSFLLKDKERIFYEERGESMRPFDVEGTMLPSGYTECPITFPPTYPYQEDLARPCEFLEKRCPAWCDRIIMSSEAETRAISASYGVIGLDVCMGDHKPVMLTIQL
ncbi:uncharacterized protein MONBRDRAFT_33207 [Monosiga brevicollis MX1]|uniref:inositol-polyphosphate 5-phosphatase n=1 Tax=Monosiga brevicollis TaxID=81824 RepID=A9V458_MONBE|nr:uncharacterized protein MONBRDRAFT_33207 [Monosiga brevicollis MX1]EDQ87562.1 predicted protein [Monosiga brevicollis MX1]|eukprot:XP_001747482.1 hypothetical protein [Monosiga brevicollis MX1]